MPATVNVSHLIASHTVGLTVLFTFLASLGLPMPISLALLMAGAAVHTTHQMPLLPFLALLWCAAIAGDTLLYFGGRHTGWWLLTWLCRLTTNPEQCIFRSAKYFYEQGPHALLFARFIPGLGAMAAPLAGSLNMPPLKFLRMDGFGAVFYTSSWVLTGYVFSHDIARIAAFLGRAGHLVLSVMGLVAVGYVVSWVVFAVKSRKFREIERVAPTLLRDRLATEDPNRLVVIADVRSHGYYDPGMTRIKNSIRVEPHRLEEELLALREFMAPECEIYLYCSCIREATSVRVAYLMNQQNCQTKVIAGGLRAWMKAGGEVEPVPAEEIEHLPRFE